MAVVVKDRSNEIEKKITQSVDNILSAMVVDVLRLSKEQVPVSKGGGTLKSTGRIHNPKYLTRQIKYSTPYASYQHRGMRADGTHVVRKYTYPGKKKRYLIDPAQQVLKNTSNYIKRYAIK